MKLMELAIAAAVALVGTTAAMSLIRRVLPRRRLRQSYRAYALRPTLSTPAEVAFLRALEAATRGKCAIHQQVALGAILQPVDGDGRAWARISQMRVDFVLADATTTQPLCVIELNDRSHATEHRRLRDAFLAEALQGQLPFLQVKCARRYDAEALRDAIDRLLAPAAGPRKEPTISWT